MLENSYEQLKKRTNLRETLSLLRSAAKEQKTAEELHRIQAEPELVTELLSDEDPKVRKNAALLIGDLGFKQAAEALFQSYQKESTLFVKSSYLSALGRLDASGYLDAFKKRLSVLTGQTPAENEKKHIQEEIRELEKLITGIQGVTKHLFSGFREPADFLLVGSRLQREVILKEASGVSSSIQRSVKTHPMGILVRSQDLIPFARLRTYRELLFPVCSKKSVPLQPVQAALAVWDSPFFPLLSGWHEGEPPFYFRLELRCAWELDKKAAFAKRFCAELEQLSGRRLINSTKDYEVEIRLIETREGALMPFFKLFTLPVKRFSYRKNVISSSIHPALAAALVQLALPYLKEHAQIIDPFCGVGTMLIERDIRVPAREKYGIDLFGEAIAKARENTALAGRRIHYINRDYFDFRHDYRFDEIITNMPLRGRKTKEETDAFYASFFEKSRDILAPDGMIILYSNEEGFVKKQLRLNPGYKLLQEFCIREKDHFYLFIIGIKG